MDKLKKELAEKIKGMGLDMMMLVEVLLIVGYEGCRTDSGVVDKVNEDSVGD